MDTSGKVVGYMFGPIPSVFEDVYFWMPIRMIYGRVYSPFVVRL